MLVIMHNIFEHEGREFTLGAPVAAAVLAEVHAGKGRPRCLCSDQRPPMYAARVAGEIILKRMPGTGHLHALACASYDPPEEMTGRAHLSSGAIRYRADGAVELRLRRPRRKTVKEEAAPAPGLEETGTGEPVGEIPAPALRERSLSVLGILHYFWDEARLTSWHPGLAGTRFWSSVREVLRAVAETSYAGGEVPMSEFLYLPPETSAEGRDAITRERQEFFDGLKPRNREGHAYGLILAPCQSHIDLPGGAAIQLRAVPSDFVMIDEAFETSFRASLKLERDLMTLDDSLLLIAWFQVVRGHQYMRIVEGALMRVDANWLPFADPRSREISRRLEGRSFVKCLDYGTGALIADAVLTDTAQATALFHTPPGASAARELALRQAAQGGPCESWFWARAQREMPPFPSPGAARINTPRRRKSRQPDPRFDII